MADALDLETCRRRQERLLETMRQLDLPLVIVTQAAHVQWLAGPCFRWFFQPAAALSVEHGLTVVVPSRHVPEMAADTVLTYEAQRHSTLRNDQGAAAASVLCQGLDDQGVDRSRVGVEFSSFGPAFARAAMQTIDIEPHLYALRRKKEADELALIQHAISATQCMYQRAREVIRPGISELDVFNHLHAAAVDQLGELPTGIGNDYQVNSRGGLPRAGHVAKEGDLYILDLGPAYRGYFADNCRTIAVTEPSEIQQQAWRHLVGVFEIVEREVRPGKSARGLFEQVQSYLDQAPEGVFNHHLGHGIGLFPHEAPHLNPNWDDQFEAGDVFTAEPGLYSEALQAGMRIENNYRVTEDGVELLTPFPLEL